MTLMNESHMTHKKFLSCTIYIDNTEKPVKPIPLYIDPLSIKINQMYKVPSFDISTNK